MLGVEFTATPQIQTAQGLSSQDLKPQKLDPQRRIAPNVAPGTQIPQAARQTAWTAPGYTPLAKLAHKNAESDQPKPRHSAHMTDTEVNRLANKVYTVLESRISREMRRMGL